MYLVLNTVTIMEPPTKIKQPISCSGVKVSPKTNADRPKAITGSNIANTDEFAEPNKLNPFKNSSIAKTVEQKDIIIIGNHTPVEKSNISDLLKIATVSMLNDVKRVTNALTIAGL